MPEILIVGAGPTGLTAAIKLAQRGVMPMVVDKRATPHGMSRAVLIHPATIETFRICGIADEVLANATTIPTIALFRNDRLMGKLRIDKLRNPTERLYGIPQHKIEEILVRRFEQLGGEILFNTECNHLDQIAEAVTVQLNGKAAVFDYVIGADGVRSFVRESVGLEFDGFELPDLWTVADVTSLNMQDPVEAKVFILPDGKTAIVVPMGNNRYRITSNIEKSAGALPISSDFTDIDNVGNFRVAIRQTNSYNVGRVYLAGDAAHSHSPIDGRGLNLGVADATDLTDRIIEGGLEGYNDARLKAGKYVIKISEYARGSATCKRLTPRTWVFLLVKVVNHIWFLNRIASRIAIHNTPLFGKLNKK